MTRYPARCVHATAIGWRFRRGRHGSQARLCGVDRCDLSGSITAEDDALPGGTGHATGSAAQTCPESGWCLSSLLRVEVLEAGLAAATSLSSSARRISTCQSW